MACTPPSAEHLAESAVFRAALRREKIAARQALSAPERAGHDARIVAGLDRLLAGRAPGCIAFCAPVRGEFDATAWVAARLAAGWTAAMPVAEVAAAPMRFRAWAPQAPMMRDRHGIPVPAGAAEVRPDLVLLPVVAFDADNFRLGYGGGYFDRTLAALAPAPLSVGVGYEVARVASIAPQAHDRALDYIVTEAGVFGPRRG